MKFYKTSSKKLSLFILFHSVLGKFFIHKRGGFSQIEVQIVNSRGILESVFNSW